MKPCVHLVSAATSGGAGRAALRLRHALEDSGLDTLFSVQRNPADGTSALGGYPLLGRPWWVAPGLSRLFTKMDRENVGIRSINYLPAGRARTINASRADVINLHWLGSDTLSIADIGTIRKPFVWTFHDMWAFCGTEHYASDASDAPWRVGYEYPVGPLNIERFIWRHKKRHFPKKGFAACPSNWLTHCARGSTLLQDWTVKTIPNALDTTVYQPMESAECRQKLSLDPNEHILLFGAQSADSDPRKGFDLVKSMMGHLAQTTSGRPLRCLVFGNSKPGPEQIEGLPVTYLGQLNTEEALVTAYGAADLVIVPSRQENLPQVATEAQSCGRPVIAFDCTGLRDVVVHNKSGILVPPFETKQGAQDIDDLLKDVARLSEMKTFARRRALDQWRPDVVAKAYTEFFQEAIAAQHASAS